MPAGQTAEYARAAGLKVSSAVVRGYAKGNGQVMKLILLGAPGAGKGTMAGNLNRMYNIPIISTGNMLRTAMKENTSVGQRAREYMDSGKLVPDDIILEILRERLSEEDCKNGYILDGVPRTIPQAEALEKAGIVLDAALSLELDDEAIVSRMAGRRACADCGASYHLVNIPPKVEGICDKCGGKLIARPDDGPGVIRERLAIYHKQTAPLKDYYEKRGILHTIPSGGDIEETIAMAVKALGR